MSETVGNSFFMTFALWYAFIGYKYYNGDFPCSVEDNKDTADTTSSPPPNTSNKPLLAVKVNAAPEPPKTEVKQVKSEVKPTAEIEVKLEEQSAKIEITAQPTLNLDEFE